MVFVIVLMIALTLAYILDGPEKKVKIHKSHNINPINSKTTLFNDIERMYVKCSLCNVECHYDRRSKKWVNSHYADGPGLELSCSQIKMIDALE